MNKIRIGLLSIFILFSSLSLSMACEFLKEQIGTSVSSLMDKYYSFDGPPEGDTEIFTYVKEYGSLSLCENSQLENTYIRVYSRENKIVGTEIIGMPGEAKNEKILKFAKTNLGYSINETIDEEWVGAINISSPVTYVLYGRIKHFEGIYETLTITKPNFLDLLHDPDLVEFF